MAELQRVGIVGQGMVSVQDPKSVAPKMIPQPVGAGPLWRSLLSPRRGQRALEFASDGTDIFGFLREAGVRVEGERGLSQSPRVVDFDLVLDDRTRGRTPVRPVRIRPLLAPGGRWVVVLEKKRWVGAAGLRLLRHARREGFESIDTFYAYPSLRSPRILVPLDYQEPFQYFLRLAVGVSAPRQRLLAFAARILCVLRLHRMLLPNLIMVARREK